LSNSFKIIDLRKKHVDARATGAYHNGICCDFIAGYLFSCFTTQ